MLCCALGCQGDVVAVKVLKRDVGDGMQTDVGQHDHHSSELRGILTADFVRRDHSQLYIAVDQQQFLLLEQASLESDLELLAERAEERLKAIFSILEFVKLVLLSLWLPVPQAFVGLVALCEQFPHEVGGDAGRATQLH